MLLSNLDVLATAPGGVARLRDLILTLAVQGKLVPQDPADEPASELLKKIRAEKDRLIAAGEIKRDKALAEIAEEEKPFELPVGWEWSRCAHYFLELCTGPFGSVIHQQDYVLDGVPLINPSHMICGRIVHDPRVTLKSEDAGRLSAYALSAGDLVLARRGEVGRYALVTEQEQGWLCGTGSFFIRLHPLCNREYLGFVFTDSGFRKHLQGESVGTTMTNLNQGILLDALISLPPLAEQSRIVTRVEELMRLCDALEAKGQLEAAQHAQLVSTLLGTLTASSTPDELADNWQRVAQHFDLLLDRPAAVDALEQTILQLAVRGLLVPQDPSDEPASQLIERIQSSRRTKRRVLAPSVDLIESAGIELPMGWAWAVIDQLSADIEYAITDGPFGANLKTEHYIAASGYRVVRLQNIGYGEFRAEHHAYIEKERFEKLKKHQVYADDLLVAGLVDESIRCCSVPESLGPAIVKADCYRFAVHEALRSDYVNLYLGSKIAHEFAAVHHHGLTLTRIGLGNFRTIPVPLPPLAEQSRIVTRVESLRRLCADLRQRLAARQVVQTQLANALVDLPSTVPSTENAADVAL